MGWPKCIQCRELFQTARDLAPVIIFTAFIGLGLDFGALLGYVFLFNLCFTIALTYLKSFEKAKSVVSDESQVAKIDARSIELQNTGEASCHVFSSLRTFSRVPAAKHWHH